MNKTNQGKNKRKRNKGITFKMNQKVENNDFRGRQRGELGIR